MELKQRNSELQKGDENWAGQLQHEKHISRVETQTPDWRDALAGERTHTAAIRERQEKWQCQYLLAKSEQNQVKIWIQYSRLIWLPQSQADTVSCMTVPMDTWWVLQQQLQEPTYEALELFSRWYISRTFGPDTDSNNINKLVSTPQENHHTAALPGLVLQERPSAERVLKEGCQKHQGWLTHVWSA